jgi:tetratricopeptide (TPR) repeat protein
MRRPRISRPRAAACLALALLCLGGDEPSSGFQRFLERQTESAKAAQRRKDWPAALAAWNAVLELDPGSLAGLDGLAGAARAAGDADAEIQALTELSAVLQRSIALGRKELERRQAEVEERLAGIDPLRPRADELLAAYSEAQRQLALDYEAEGLPACAITAWGLRQRLELPGSPGRVEAASAIDRLRQESPAYVAMRFNPGIILDPRDEAWIEELDKRSAKFSNALKAETPHYRIKTNAGWNMLQAAQTAMEQVHAFYREIWGIVPDPAPRKVPEGLREIAIPLLTVQIFATRDEYIHRTGSGKSDWSGGHYNGSEVNTYDHGEGGGLNGIPATMRTLFHEASHQFMHQCVGGAPSFVNEGVASLFEGIELLPNGEVRRDLPVLGYLMPLADALAEGSAMSLRGVFGAHENKPELYKYRWGVFYFVRMYVDETGRYPFRDRLVDYIYEFKRGELGDLAAHFEQFFLEPAALPGLEDFDAFERTWREWILGLDEELKASDKRLVSYKKQARAELRYGAARALDLCDKALDIDPDDLETLHLVALACDSLEQKDRALATWRRVLEAADAEDPRRKEALERIAALDPLGSRWADARRDLAGGMAALALDRDAAGQPLMAMTAARSVLGVDPFDPSARALVTRLERETGRSVVRWERLFNGFDLQGWYGVEGGKEAFSVRDGALLCDSSKAPKAGPNAPTDGITYHALLCTRQVQGDWAFEAALKTGKDWQIAGLVFGAKDGSHYEAIVLRKGTDGSNRVDYGSFAEGMWTFPRNDGALKTAADPVAGARLRIEVRGRQVSVFLDEQRLEPVAGGKKLPSIRYPLSALRGDIGLLGSRGTTTFTDVRLRAVERR